MITYLNSDRLFRYFVVMVSFLWIGCTEARSIDFTAENKEKIRDVWINYQSSLKIDVLVGEPVVSLALRWQVSKEDSYRSTVEVPSFEGGTRELKSISLFDLSDEALTKINIFDVHLLIEFHLYPYAGERYFMIVNAGAIAKGDGKTWSFNPPGSPNWQKLFLESHVFTGDFDINDESNYVKSDKAKEIYYRIINSDSSVTFSMYSVKMSFYDLQNWYVKNNPRPEIELLKRNIYDLEEGISSAFGYEFRKPTRQMIYEMDLPREIAKLRALYEKLENLPLELTREGKGDLYSSTVSDTRLNFYEFERWESSEDRYETRKMVDISRENTFSLDESNNLLVNGVNACHTKYVECDNSNDRFFVGINKYIAFDKYLVYVDFEDKIYIRDLRTKEVIKTIDTLVSKNESGGRLISSKKLSILKADSNSLVFLEYVSEYFYRGKKNKNSLTHVRASECYHYIADSNLKFVKQKVETGGLSSSEIVFWHNSDLFNTSYFGKCNEGYAKPLGQ